MKVGTYKIPFQQRADGTWDMLEYSHLPEGCVVERGKGFNDPHEWRHNAPFTAKLAITGQYRGRSAARVTVKNIANGDTYSLGLSAFVDAVVAFGSAGGVIDGRWVFRKQGANYGVYPLTRW
jgi:hypothetical protein